MDFENKLRKVRERYEELNQILSDPGIFQRPSEFAEFGREHTQLKALVEQVDRWLELKQQLSENEQLIEQDEDPEITQMAREENREIRPKIEALEEEIHYQLLPKNPEDSRNCIMEIRAGTGGDEAALFAGDLYEMYRRFADDQGWEQRILSLQPSEKGGVKEIVFELHGPDAYGQMKYESGVHRVQRVPATESQGRIHTSAATVAVLPEAEEVDVKLDMKDIRVDTFRSSGAGGQHVNKTDSAIRLTHIPTGTVAECQQERSQHQNKEKALMMLRSKLYEVELQKIVSARDASRKSQVSTGDRSAKIRTYNFPQGRFTDHRIHLTLYNLEEILKGDLAEVIKALRVHDQLEKMNETA